MEARAAPFDFGPVRGPTLRAKGENSGRTAERTESSGRTECGCARPPRPGPLPRSAEGEGGLAETQKDEAGTPPVSREVPASSLAGCRGLEPLASGVTVGASRRAGARQVSQAVGNARKRAAQDGSASPRVAPFSRPLGTPLVRSPLDGAHGHVLLSLTVRQVSEALRVSTAAIYKGVADGRIQHVRVGNVIRIPVRPTAGQSPGA